MLSDYDEPYQVYEHLNDNYRILFFTGLEKHVFKAGNNYLVEEYVEESGDWDTMRGGSMLGSFEEADKLIQKRIKEDENE